MAIACLSYLDIKITFHLSIIGELRSTETGGSIYLDALYMSVAKNHVKRQVTS